MADSPAMIASRRAITAGSGSGISIGSDLLSSQEARDQRQSRVIGAIGLERCHRHGLVPQGGDIAVGVLMPAGAVEMQPIIRLAPQIVTGIDSDCPDRAPPL